MQDNRKSLLGTMMASLLRSVSSNDVWNHATGGGDLDFVWKIKCSLYPAWMIDFVCCFIIIGSIRDYFFKEDDFWQTSKNE